MCYDLLVACMHECLNLDIAHTVLYFWRIEPTCPVVGYQAFVFVNYEIVVKHSLDCEILIFEQGRFLHDSV